MRMWPGLLLGRKCRLPVSKMFSTEKRLKPLLVLSLPLLVRGDLRTIFMGTNSAISVPIITCTAP